MVLTDRIEIVGQPGERFAEILTPGALDFIASLDNAFAGRRCDLLAARRERQERLADGERFDFLPETKAIRDDAGW